MNHKSYFLLSAILLMVQSTTSNAHDQSVIPGADSPPSDTKMVKLNAMFSNGFWAINGKQKPVFKTNPSSRNYMQIHNDSVSHSLNLVIPKLEYSVIAKNSVLLEKPISLTDETSGKTILWIEPKSSLTLTFLNDLANTPLQAMVSVEKKSKDVIAIFGPDQGSKFSLPTPVKDTPETNYKDLGLISIKRPKASNPPALLTISNSESKLKSSYKYRIDVGDTGRHMRFSEPVFVVNRNTFIGGSDYWTKEIMVSPKESFSLWTSKETVLRMKDE